jgi:hypothetical protein
VFTPARSPNCGVEAVERSDRGGQVSQLTSLLPVGQVLEISFPTFTPRITSRSDRELTVETVAGEGVSFSDRVEYQTIVVRDDIVILSWQEHIGSTIVHVLDLSACKAHTAVTPAKGGFMRLTGPIVVRGDIASRSWTAQRTSRSDLGRRSTRLRSKNTLLLVRLGINT